MSQKISLSAQELHRKFVVYGRNAREWTRKCALLLPEIEKERIWEKKGFESIYVYAAKLAGMSREGVTDALRVLRVTEGMMEIRKVIEQRGINIIKPILTVLTRDNQTFWAEKAMCMSQHTLEVYRQEVVRQDSASMEFGEKFYQESGKEFGQGLGQSLSLFGRPSGSSVEERASSENEEFPQQQAIDISMEGKSTPRKILVMDLDLELAEKMEKLRVVHDGDWNAAIRGLLETRDKVLHEEQRRIQEEVPAATKASSRHIPAEIEQFVIKRSGGICEFPTCAKKYAILHHTQRFALEEVHDPERIIALCTAHERLAHLGLIEYENQKPEKWAVRQEADASEEKYIIDRQVQKFRAPWHEPSGESADSSTDSRPK